MTAIGWYELSSPQLLHDVCPCPVVEFIFGRMMRRQILDQAGGRICDGSEADLITGDMICGFLVKS